MTVVRRPLHLCLSHLHSLELFGLLLGQLAIDLKNTNCDYKFLNSRNFKLVESVSSIRFFGFTEDLLFRKKLLEN